MECVGRTYAHEPNAVIGSLFSCLRGSTHDFEIRAVMRADGSIAYFRGLPDRSDKGMHDARSWRNYTDMMRVLNVLVRRCLPLAALDSAVAFHEALVGKPARLRFDYPERALKLAQVVSILLIGGDAGSLAPFVATDATFLVEDIEA
jgi:hypothetical protein